MVKVSLFDLIEEESVKEKKKARKLTRENLRRYCPYTACIYACKYLREEVQTSGGMLIVQKGSVQ